QLQPLRKRQNIHGKRQCANQLLRGKPTGLPKIQQTQLLLQLPEQAVYLGSFFHLSSRNVKRSKFSPQPTPDSGAGVKPQTAESGYGWGHSRSGADATDGTLSF